MVLYTRCSGRMIHLRLCMRILRMVQYLYAMCVRLNNNCLIGTR